MKYSLPDLTIEQAKHNLKMMRLAARYRRPETGRRHFCHDPLFRAAYVKDIFRMRKILLGTNTNKICFDSSVG